MNAIDQLGTIQAQIAELRKQEAALKGEIFDSGETEGMYFKAAIVEQDRRNTNWKKIAQDLGASAQRIRANSTTTHVTSLKVTARSTAARRAA